MTLQEAFKEGYKITEILNDYLIIDNIFNNSYFQFKTNEEYDKYNIEYSDEYDYPLVLTLTEGVISKYYGQSLLHPLYEPNKPGIKSGTNLLNRNRTYMVFKNLHQEYLEELEKVYPNGGYDYFRGCHWWQLLFYWIDESVRRTTGGILFDMNSVYEQNDPNVQQLLRNPERDKMDTFIQHPSMTGLFKNCQSLEEAGKIIEEKIYNLLVGVISQALISGAIRPVQHPGEFMPNLLNDINNLYKSLSLFDEDVKTNFFTLLGARNKFIMDALPRQEELSPVLQQHQEEFYEMLYTAMYNVYSKTKKLVMDYILCSCGKQVFTDEFKALVRMQNVQQQQVNDQMTQQLAQQAIQVEQQANAPVELVNWQPEVKVGTYDLQGQQVPQQQATIQMPVQQQQNFGAADILAQLYQQPQQAYSAIPMDQQTAEYQQLDPGAKNIVNSMIEALKTNEEIKKDPHKYQEEIERRNKELQELQAQFQTGTDGPVVPIVHPQNCTCEACQNK